MGEKERKSIHYFISAAAAEEKKERIYRVSGGKKLKLERGQVFFPTGTDFELEVAVFRSLEQIKPTDGTYRGDGNVLVDITGVWFGPGDEIILWWKNNSTADVRKATVLLEGFEE